MFFNPFFNPFGGDEPSDEEIHEMEAAWQEALEAQLKSHEECQRANRDRNEGIYDVLRDHQERCHQREAGGQLQPTRFVAVVEYARPDGGRELVAHVPDNVTDWEVTGMLGRVLGDGP